MASMVRETRHLWVGNLPENIREDKIIEHLKRYGRVENVKLTGKRNGDGGVSAYVDFVDICSASKAHDSITKIGDLELRIEYNNSERSPDSLIPEDAASRLSHSRDSYDAHHSRHSRYDSRRDWSLEDRYDHQGTNYEYGSRSYDRHYGRDSSYHEDENLPASLRDRSRDRPCNRGGNYYSHSNTNARTEGQNYDPEQDPHYSRDSNFARDSDNISDSSLRKNQHRQKRGRSSCKSSCSPKSGSVARSRSYSRSASRSRSRSRSSVSGSETNWSSTRGWSRSKESDRESRNTENTQSSGAPKHAELCIKNLASRSTDSSIKDGLFHEFKKYGQVTAVTVTGTGEDRAGIVFFKRTEDMEKALNQSKGKLFFGWEMKLSVWDGPDIGVDDSDIRYYEKELDEFHPRATRTVFIGNLDRCITREELRDAFHKFGDIVDIEIKKPQGAQPFAFLQFSDIDSVVKARKTMDGEYVGKNKVKLGFGKSMATSCIWLDNLSEKLTEHQLSRFFSLRFGPVSRIVLDKNLGRALVFFYQLDHAQKTMQEIKNGLKISGSRRRPKVDFASRECQNQFYDRMEKTGQSVYSRESSPGGSYDRGFKNSPGHFNDLASSHRPSRSRNRREYSSSDRGHYHGPAHGQYPDDRYPAQYSPNDSNYYRNRRCDDEAYTSGGGDGDDSYEKELCKYRYHQKENKEQQYRDKSDSPHDRYHPHVRRRRSDSADSHDPSPTRSPYRSKSGSPISFKKKRTPRSTVTVQNKDGSQTPIPRSPPSPTGSHWSGLGRGHVFDDSDELGSSAERGETHGKLKHKSYRKDYLSSCNTTPRVRDSDDEKSVKSVLSDKSSKERRGHEWSVGVESKERTKDKKLLREARLPDDTFVAEEIKEKKKKDLLKAKKTMDLNERTSDIKMESRPIGYDPKLHSGVPSTDGDIPLKRRRLDTEQLSYVVVAPEESEMQRKLEARAKRFSDNNPVQLRKKVPKSVISKPVEYKENIVKSDSVLEHDTRTVVDSHGRLAKDPGNKPDRTFEKFGVTLHTDHAEISSEPDFSVAYGSDAKAVRPDKEDINKIKLEKMFAGFSDAGDFAEKYRKSPRLDKSPRDKHLSHSSLHQVCIDHLLDVDPGGSSSDTPLSDEETTPRLTDKLYKYRPRRSLSSGGSPRSIVQDKDLFEKPQIDISLSYRKQMEQARKSFEREREQQEKDQDSNQEKHDTSESRHISDKDKKSDSDYSVDGIQWKLIPLDLPKFIPKKRKLPESSLPHLGSDGDVKRNRHHNDSRKSVESAPAAAAAISPQEKKEEVKTESTQPEQGGVQNVQDKMKNTAEPPSKALSVDISLAEGGAESNLPLLSPSPLITPISVTVSENSPSSAAPHLSPVVTPMKLDRPVLSVSELFPKSDMPETSVVQSSTHSPTKVLETVSSSSVNEPISGLSTTTSTPPSLGLLSRHTFVKNNGEDVKSTPELVQKNSLGLDDKLDMGITLDLRPEDTLIPSSEEESGRDELLIQNPSAYASVLGKNKTFTFMPTIAREKLNVESNLREPRSSTGNTPPLTPVTPSTPITPNAPVDPATKGGEAKVIKARTIGRIKKKAKSTDTTVIQEENSKQEEDDTVQFRKRISIFDQDLERLQHSASKYTPTGEGGAAEGASGEGNTDVVVKSESQNDNAAGKGEAATIRWRDSKLISLAPHHSSSPDLLGIGTSLNSLTSTTVCTTEAGLTLLTSPSVIVRNEGLMKTLLAASNTMSPMPSILKVKPFYRSSDHGLMGAKDNHTGSVTCKPASEQLLTVEITKTDDPIKPKSILKSPTTLIPIIKPAPLSESQTPNAVKVEKEGGIDKTGKCIKTKAKCGDNVNMVKPGKSSLDTSNELPIKKAIKPDSKTSKSAEIDEKSNSSSKSNLEVVAGKAELGGKSEMGKSDAPSQSEITAVTSKSSSGSSTKVVSSVKPASKPVGSKSVAGAKTTSTSGKGPPLKSGQVAKVTGQAKTSTATKSSLAAKPKSVQSSPSSKPASSKPTATSKSTSKPTTKPTSKPDASKPSASGASKPDSTFSKSNATKPSTKVQPTKSPNKKPLVKGSSTGCTNSTTSKSTSVKDGASKGGRDSTSSTKPTGGKDSKSTTQKESAGQKSGKDTAIKPAKEKPSFAKELTKLDSKEATRNSKEGSLKSKSSNLSKDSSSKTDSSKDGSQKTPSKEGVTKKPSSSNLTKDGNKSGKESDKSKESTSKDNKESSSKDKDGKKGEKSDAKSKVKQDGSKSSSKSSDSKSSKTMAEKNKPLPEPKPMNMYDSVKRASELRKSKTMEEAAASDSQESKASDKAWGKEKASSKSKEKEKMKEKAKKEQEKREEKAKDKLEEKVKEKAKAKVKQKEKEMKKAKEQEKSKGKGKEKEKAKKSKMISQDSFDSGDDSDLSLPKSKPKSSKGTAKGGVAALMIEMVSDYESEDSETELQLLAKGRKNNKQSKKSKSKSCAIWSDDSNEDEDSNENDTQDTSDVGESRVDSFPDSEYDDMDVSSKSSKDTEPPSKSSKKSKTVKSKKQPEPEPEMPSEPEPEPEVPAPPEPEEKKEKPTSKSKEDNNNKKNKEKEKEKEKAKEKKGDEKAGKDKDKDHKVSKSEKNADKATKDADKDSSPPETPSGNKERKNSGKFSLFARIKSHREQLEAKAEEIAKSEKKEKKAEKDGEKEESRKHSKSKKKGASSKEKEKVVEESASTDDNKSDVSSALTQISKKWTEKGSRDEEKERVQEKGSERESEEMEGLESEETLEIQSLMEETKKQVPKKPPPPPPPPPQPEVNTPSQDMEPPRKEKHEKKKHKSSKKKSKKDKSGSKHAEHSEEEISGSRVASEADVDETIDAVVAQAQVAFLEKESRMEKNALIIDTDANMGKGPDTIFSSLDVHETIVEEVTTEEPVKKHEKKEKSKKAKKRKKHHKHRDESESREKQRKIIEEEEEEDDIPVLPVIDDDMVNDDVLAKIPVEEKPESNESDFKPIEEDSMDKFDITKQDEIVPAYMDKDPLQLESLISASAEERKHPELDSTSTNTPQDSYDLDIDKIPSAKRPKLEEKTKARDFVEETKLATSFLEEQASEIELEQPIIAAVLEPGITERETNLAVASLNAAQQQNTMMLEQPKVQPDVANLMQPTIEQCIETVLPVEANPELSLREEEMLQKAAAAEISEEKDSVPQPKPVEPAVAAEPIVEKSPELLISSPLHIAEPPETPKGGRRRGRRKTKAQKEREKKAEAEAKALLAAEEAAQMEQEKLAAAKSQSEMKSPEQSTQLGLGYQQTSEGGLESEQAPKTEGVKGESELQEAVAEQEETEAAVANILVAEEPSQLDVSQDTCAIERGIEITPKPDVMVPAPQPAAPAPATPVQTHIKPIIEPPKQEVKPVVEPQKVERESRREHRHREHREHREHHKDHKEHKEHKERATYSQGRTKIILTRNRSASFAAAEPTKDFSVFDFDEDEESKQSKPESKQSKPESKQSKPESKQSKPETAKKGKTTERSLSNPEGQTKPVSHVVEEPLQKSTTTIRQQSAEQQLEELKANQPPPTTATSPRHMTTRSASQAAAATTPTIRTHSQAALKKDDVYDFQPSPSPQERSPGRSPSTRPKRGRGRGRGGRGRGGAGRGRGAAAAAKEDTPEPRPGASETPPVETESPAPIPTSKPSNEPTEPPKSSQPVVVSSPKSSQPIVVSSAPPMVTVALSKATMVIASQASSITPPQPPPTQVSTTMTPVLPKTVLSQAKTVVSTVATPARKISDMIRSIPISSPSQIVKTSQPVTMPGSTVYAPTVPIVTAVTTIATTAAKVQVTSGTPPFTHQQPKLHVAQLGVPITQPPHMPPRQVPGHIVPTTSLPRTTSATATSQIVTVACTAQPISTPLSLSLATAPQRFPAGVQQQAPTQQNVSVSMPAVVKALGTPSVATGQRAPRLATIDPSQAVIVGALLAAQAAQVVRAPKPAAAPGRPPKRGRRRRESTDEEKLLAHKQAMALQHSQHLRQHPQLHIHQIQQQQQQQQQKLQQQQQQQQQQLTPQQLQDQLNAMQQQRRLQELQEVHRQHQQKEQQQQQMQMQQVNPQQLQNIRQHPPTTIAPQMRQLISQETAAKAGAQAAQLHHMGQPHVRAPGQLNDALVNLEQQTSPTGRTPEVQILRPSGTSGAPHGRHVPTIVSSHGMTPASAAAHQHGIQEVPTSLQLKPGQHTSGILVIASSATPTKPLTTMATNASGTMTTASQPTSSANVIADGRKQFIPYTECRVPTSVAAQSYPDASVLRARLTSGSGEKTVLPPKKEKLEQLAQMAPIGMAQLQQQQEGKTPHSQMSPMGMPPDPQKVAHMDLQRVTPGARTPGPTGKPEETEGKKRTQSNPGSQWLPGEQPHIPAFRTPEGKLVYMNASGIQQALRQNTPASQAQMVLSTDMVYPGMVPPQFYLDPKQAEKIPGGNSSTPVAGMISPEQIKSGGQGGQVFYQPTLGIPGRYGVMFPSGMEGQPLPAQGAGRIASPNLPPPGASSPAVSPRVKSPAVVHAEHPHPSVTPEKIDITKGEMPQHQMLQPGITCGIPPQRAPGITSGIPPQMHHAMPQLVMRKQGGGYNVEPRVHPSSKPEEQPSPRDGPSQDAMHQRTPVVADTYPHQSHAPHHMKEPHMVGHPEQDSVTPRAPNREYQPGVPREPTPGTWPAQGTPSEISPHTPIGIHLPNQPLSPMPPSAPDSLRRYPIMWQGLLALKNDIAAIQMHYVSGSETVARDSLVSQMLLRIAQRMRLEPSQLEGVGRRMTVEDESVVLLVLPCGRDRHELDNQTACLKTNFITYLQQKQAAGIINVAIPTSTEPSFVLHIFPPCEFTHENLHRVAPDLLESIVDMNVAYLMVVIATT